MQIVWFELVSTSPFADDDNHYTMGFSYVVTIKNILINLRFRSQSYIMRHVPCEVGEIEKELVSYFAIVERQSSKICLKSYCFISSATKDIF